MRDRFVIADPDLIYLDGNSLGRLPVAAEAALRESVTQRSGASDLVRAWPGWIDEPPRVGDVLAAGVLGAEPGEVLVGDSTTVNLFKLAGSSRACGTRGRPAPHHPRHDRRQLPHRPLRPRRASPSCSACSCGSSRYDELDAAPRRRTPRCCACRTSSTSPASGATSPPSPSSPASAACACCGTCRTPPAACPSQLAAGAGRSRRRLHVQVPERRPRRARLPLRPARPAAAAATRRSAAGSASRTSSRWNAITRRPTGIRRFAAGHAADPRAAAGRDRRRPHRRSRDRPPRRQERRTSPSMIIELADAWLAPLGFRVATPRDPARRGAHVSLAHAAALADLPGPRSRRPASSPTTGPAPDGGGTHPARAGSALHPPRRRLGRDGPATRPGRRPEST